MSVFSSGFKATSRQVFIEKGIYYINLRYEMSNLMVFEVFACKILTLLLH